MAKDQLEALETLARENAALRNFTTPHGDTEGELPHRRPTPVPPPLTKKQQEP